MKMGSSGRYKRTRSKKRRFYGNTASKRDNLQQGNELSGNEKLVNENLTTEVHNVSASSSKLDTSTVGALEGEIAPECYVMFNTDSLIAVLLMIGRCPNCIDAIEVQHALSEKRGLAHFFNISCTSCNWSIKLCSSKELNIHKMAVASAVLPLQ